MNNDLLNDIGVLALRVSLAYVYLHGALMIFGSRKRRIRTAERSLVLVANTRLGCNAHIGRALMIVAMFFMIAGGIGVFTGIWTRLAAGLLILFTLPGIIIHVRELQQSIQLVDDISYHEGSELNDKLTALRWLCYAGHRSSANKNYTLIGVAVFLILANDPNGRFSLSALFEF